MTANPLVAGPVDTSTAFGGAGVLESVTDLCSSLESGSWVAIGLAGVGAALDVAATVIDPLGSLIGAGLGWLMEHLEPLKGWLNDLTGDAGAVLGFAGTWQNVADAMGAAGDELTRVVRADLEAMTGASISAYSAYAEGLADRIRATGGSASAIGGALKTCAMVVQVVHDLVRDTLASLVGSIISWAAEAVFTLGLATPVIVGQVSTRVSSLATKVGRSVTDVISSAKSLKNLLEALQDVLRRLASGVRGKLPGAKAPDAPHRLPVSDGKPRNLYDQVNDPHIHPSNADVVEPGYDPFGGLPRDEFMQQYHSRINKYGDPDWDWPPHNGAVPGSETTRPLTAADNIRMDRIGGDGGEYFSPQDTPMSQRALPPDRLNFERTDYRVNTSHPEVANGHIHIETSDIAPWFGQPGGGVQYRFTDGAGNFLTQGDLIRFRILTKVVP